MEACALSLARAGYQAVSFDFEATADTLSRCLMSLGIAVAMNFQERMFLLLIAPVIVLFWLVYGTAAGFVGRRCGQPLVPGVALGLILAWAVGASFSFSCRLSRAFTRAAPGACIA